MDKGRSHLLTVVIYEPILQQLVNLMQASSWQYR